MKINRLNAVLAQMKSAGLSQMLVSDPYSILYLTGRWIDPGERLYVLYLNTNGNHKMFINELFTVPEDLGVEKIRFSDTDDSMVLLAAVIAPAEQLGIDKNMAARFLLALMELNAAAGYCNSSLCLDRVRACKDEEERSLMRRASLANDKGIEIFKTLVKDGMTELDVARRMEEIYRAQGADGLSFEPLVGFGKNAAVGHYAAGNTVVQPGDCVLFDVGCAIGGYCADMTRTYFYKEVSDKQREVYELVKQANETAESIIKPGVRFCDIDKAARDVIEQAGYGEYFTHRLGHSIGMEVHEFGDVSSANTDEVQEGMIFSIEPGIYLQGEFGVRIEDLVLVTKDGCEVLNATASKELQIIG